ncbi:MAG: DUF3343 domain-containing protein [Ruminococcaceae bacterium]|nr:DUF3343 domain-containing protein [Oscillospiraceae bacterium]
MQNQGTPGTCNAVIGSVTQAMRAQRLLVGGKVMARVIKASPKETGRGCAYAVTYPCQQADEARELLRRGGIRIRGGDG